MHSDALALVRALELIAHPEGGFYRETHTSMLSIDAHGGARPASTAIYFMLPGGTFSALHRLRSDEVWHHYDGDPVALHLLDEGGARVIELGRDIARGQRPQAVIPAGTLQAAMPIGDRFALCGCTVAPGFVFSDFAMPSRAELCAQFPEHRDIVNRFTRG